jgi:hypothetical protein
MRRVWPFIVWVAMALATYRIRDLADFVVSDK